MRRTALNLLFAVLSFAPLTLAQTGFPPFGSFEQSGFDAVNRQNLNAIFSIPIMSIPGRGQNFQYDLVNNSLVWTQTGGSPNAWTPVVDASGHPTWGWAYGPASGSGQVLTIGSGHVCKYIDPNTGLWAYASYAIYSNFKYEDWLGTIHPFSTSLAYIVASTSAQQNCGIQNGPFPLSGLSTDNTGFKLTITAPGVNSVLSPAGVAGGGALADTNGNYASATVVNSTETDWTDTAGHLALKAFTNSTNLQYEWQDSNGNYTSATTTTVQLSTLNIKTNFACSGISEYTGTASLPTEIDLPNGQKYSVTYEPTPGNSGYYTGRVRRVTLPTGGYYEYDYPTTAGDGIVCADSSVNSLTRIINDGTNTYTWSFSRANLVTTVTAPQMPYDTAANNTVYTFNSIGQQTSAQFYQGAVNSANLKRSVNTTWAGNGSPATQITILEDGKTENEIATSYDNYGNILSLVEHDWGSGSPGAPLRTTSWTYLNSSAYTNLNILNRPTNITVTDNVLGVVHSRTDIAYDESGYDNYTCVSGAAQHNDANYGCSFTTRGNPTTVTTYTNAATPSGGIAHHRYYDNLGNLVRADLDCCQSKTWSYSAMTQYSFPDSSTRGSSPGPQLTRSATYNPYTGLVATSTDENGQVTHYSYDNLKRPTSVVRPDNAQLTWSYQDTPPVSVAATVPIQGSSVQKTITAIDGLNRPIQQQITDGTTTYSIVATQYDPLGRPWKTSNPYTSSPQYSSTQYDALSRPSVNILPDNSQTTFAYAANTATVTDPAAKQKKSQVDGLGRMTSVWEPDPANGNSLTLQTSYSYNILDLLTGVTQGSQTRTYVYDDLGRVTSVKIPETNQVAYQYQYSNFGLVTQRTDPRGVITGYGYDTLNRLTGISYNVGSTGVPSTPSVTLTYDQGGASAYALGRLTSMTDGVGSETYTHNNLGEATQLQKVISGTTYTLSYAYNLAGELSSITYPSGRNVQQSFDNIGRLSSVADTYNSVNTTRASGYSYNAAFQVTGFSYGNGVTATIGYTTDRLLLQSLAYAKGSTALFSTSYWYKTDSTNCPNGAAGNNGQIQCITDNVDSGRTVSYAYDALYRLTNATTNGSASYPQWGLSMVYDRYGNRTAQSASSGCVYPMVCPTNSVTVSPTTNQITGSSYAYDANGNMTNDGNNSLTYDAENRVLSASGSLGSGSYTYDGNNLRVQKSSAGTTIVTIFSGAQVIAEYVNGAPPSSPTNEYIYAGGQRIAAIQSGSTYYWHYDHLSPRVRTDSNGNLADQRGTFPFGEAWYSPSGAPWVFTSYYRDTESGNDYALARTYISRLARFSSLDVLSGSPVSPQSLNKYTYTANDPVNLTDPSGNFYGPGMPYSGDEGGGVYFMGGGSYGDGGLPEYLNPHGGGGGNGKIPLQELIPNNQPPPPPGYEQCITAALEAMIANNEGTNAKPNGGYGSLANGVVTSAPYPLNIFVGMSNVQIPNPGALPGHPGIHVQAGQWNTTAFGRYQILQGTAVSLGPGGTPWTDFSPAGQDAAAAQIMNRLGMVQDAMAGQIVQAIWDGNTTWASLPDSPYGQPTWSWAATMGAFQNALNTLPECQ